MKRLLLLLTCLLVAFSLVACVGTAGPQGVQGEKGEQGIQGLPGEDGKDGKDGVSPTVTISEDGYWVINGEKTEYKAVGTNGIDGSSPTIEIDNNGYWVINGETTEYKAIGTDGSNGTDGIDGTTPTIAISDDGYWIINGEKTEHKAIGTDGKDGKEGTTPTISIDPDGYIIINGNKTEYKLNSDEVCTHSYGDYTVKCGPTCDTNGLDIRTCNICGNTDYRITKTTEHAYTDTVISPTCNMNGYTEHVCKDCGKSYKDSETLATGEHIFYNLYVLESTCISRKVLKACSLCNALAVLDEEPIAEHNYVDRACSICGELQPSEGLEYKLNSNQKSYSVTGIGTCTDNDIVVPSIYNDLPVTSIGNWAFADCYSLTSITIPSSVTSIGWYAFARCDSLTSITIPSSVTSIGSYAFVRCDSLTNIIVDANNEKYKSIDGNLYTKDGKTLIQYAIGKKDTSFIIPDGVTSIGSDAFSNCKNLTSITIPSSVTSIGNYAFYYCSILYVVYNYSNLELEVGSKDNGYAACYAKILVNGDITSYADDGYEYTLTDDNFLFRCKGTKYELIAYCGTEETVILPNDINGNEYSICRMRGVRNVIIPSSVTSIGDSAFEYCDSLATVYYTGTASEWDSISIGGWNSKLTDATRYYYSETEPTTSGNYWHYVDGEIVVW